MTVTSATNSGTLPEVYTDINYLAGSGFDVAGGQVTGVDIAFSETFRNLELGNVGGAYHPRYYQLFGSFDNADSDKSPSNTLSFAPVGPASVPAPLPLLGAGAAFGWSRRLRCKIKATA